jgi:hypothetical protein
VQSSDDILADFIAQDDAQDGEPPVQLAVTQRVVGLDAVTARAVA